jgi:hypothetical protein
MWGPLRSDITSNESDDAEDAVRNLSCPVEMIRQQRINWMTTAGRPMLTRPHIIKAI